MGALTATEIRQKAKQAGAHIVGGVDRGSLLLIVEADKAGGTRARWQYRARFDGQTRTKGLGGYPAVTLKQARDKAREIAIDPAAYFEREALRKAAKVQPNAGKPCGELFAEWIEYQRSVGAWKSEKDYARKLRALNTWAAPVIGQMQPDAVRREHIVEILRPVWAVGKGGNGQTGGKLRGAVIAFFDWLIDIEHLRDSEKGNPALGIKAAALPKQSVQQHHQPACPIEDLPRFVAILTEPQNFTLAGMALLFAILTWSRHANIARQDNSADRNYAIWPEIHREHEGGALWIIPAEKMKRPQNGAHYVPLSRAALAILDRLDAMGLNRGGAVFTTRGGNPFSNGAFRALIRRIAQIDRERGGTGFIDPAEDGRLMTPHGTARSTSKSWAARKGFGADICEIALHHVKDGYGYQRDNAIDRRREMMEQWAAYCLSKCPPDWAAIK